MALVTLQDVEKSYGDQKHLLRGVSLVVGEGDRIGLVGPNGAGKSTLMRILAGLEEHDAGHRTQQRGVRLGYLSQEPELPAELNVHDAVRGGLPEREVILAELDSVHTELERASSSALLSRQAALEDELAHFGGHDIEHRVSTLVDALGLADAATPCGSLSGGERRRVALARLLLSAPDLMLLDEPTNHLDAWVTQWLEDHLRALRTPLLMVTHDRYFLDRVVDRIVELDRGRLHTYDGGYRGFLEARAERLASEKKTEDTRLNLLRRETEWMRRGPQGRGTKAKGRIRAYEALQDGAREKTAEAPVFSIPPGPRLGTQVVRLSGVSKSFGDRAVLRKVDLDIEAGDRIGIVGKNGAGKTTLLRILMEQETPDEGQVTVGSTVRFAYMDQARADLDPLQPLSKSIDATNVHAALEKFGFAREAFDTPVGELSGGERNRVLLLRLLLRGGNVLVLDEPTNDLDLMTLRVLEEALLAFPGTVLAVSHDRFFLDRISTRILRVDLRGFREVPGDVSSLLKEPTEPTTKKRPKPRGRTRQPARLSYHEKQELKELPDRIAAAEEELATLDAKLADPVTYTRPDVGEVTARRKVVAQSVQDLYARWEDLEGR